MDWNDLKAFLAVAREGSTLAASKSLGVNQTTVARRIESLEAAVGLKLFERGQTGSRLTEAGQDLLAEAERMEQAAAGFTNRAGGHQRSLTGTLRVTSTEIMANLGVTPGLGRFRELYPDLKVEVIITDLVLDLAGAEADIAIRTAVALPDSDLMARKITDFEFAFYASRDYLMRRGLPRSMEDLRRHDVIAGDGTHLPLPGMAWMLDQVPGLEPTMRINATTQLLHALKAGLGVAPFGCILADLEPDLVRCLPPIPPPTPAVWMVTRAELKDTPRVRAFIDFFIPYMEQTRRGLVEHGQTLQDRKMAELEAAMAG